MIQIGMFLEDRYEILEKIGTGGMSDVYKAKCHKLNRYVAIKFLKPEFCEDKNFVANFKVEAQSAAALLHPNVVSVYDVNETDGIYYIVMEYVDGITLKKYISINGKLPSREATSIAIQVAQGMEAAHNAGIIHRDIKPQNVLISREGKIKVTDFGIARTTTANTLSADVLGSAQYISPEQARGDTVDTRSDIYSFGIMYYEMLTGKLPFEGDSPVAIALKHIQEQVPLVSESAPDVPSSVVKIVEKCTQKRTDRRYQKTSSLLADLKTSLVNPNDDFVVLEAENDEGATVIMTRQDAELLKKETVRDDDDDEEIINPRKRILVDTEEDDEDYYDDDEEDPSGRRFDKVLTVCGVIAGIIILGVLIVVLVTNFFGSGCTGCSGTGRRQSSTETTESTAAVDTAEMPELVGKTTEEAKKILDDLNIEYEIKTEASDKPEGEILRQSLVAGSTVVAGTKITLTASAGQDLVKLEDLAGKKQEDAVKILKDAGLKSRITTKYDSNVETGLVIETNPGKDTEVPKGSTVELIISRGSEAKLSTVPQLVGYSEVAAWEMARDAGLVPEVHYEENAESVGLVTHQSLSAGSSVEEGSYIALIVGIEPETEAPVETEAPETEAPEETTEEEPVETTAEEPVSSEEPSIEETDPSEGGAEEGGAGEGGAEEGGAGEGGAGEGGAGEGGAGEGGAEENGAGEGEESTE